MIAVIDDMPVFRILVKHTFRKSQALLSNYNLDYKVQAFSKITELIQDIENSEHSYSILLLDYNLSDDITIENEFHLLAKHTLLKSTIIIGWSRHLHTVGIFKQLGAHGFISKERSERLVEDVLQAIAFYHKREWFEFT